MPKEASQPKENLISGEPPVAPEMEAASGGTKGGDSQPETKNAGDFKLNPLAEALERANIQKGKNAEVITVPQAPTSARAQQEELVDYGIKADKPAEAPIIQRVEAPTPVPGAHKKTEEFLTELTKPNRFLTEEQNSELVEKKLKIKHEAEAEEGLKAAAAENKKLRLAKQQKKSDGGVLVQAPPGKAVDQLLERITPIAEERREKRLSGYAESRKKVGVRAEVAEQPQEVVVKASVPKGREEESAGRKIEIEKSINNGLQKEILVKQVETLLGEEIPVAQQEQLYTQKLPESLDWRLESKALSFLHDNGLLNKVSGDLSVSEFGYITAQETVGKFPRSKLTQLRPTELLQKIVPADLKRLQDANYEEYVEAAIGQRDLHKTQPDLIELGFVDYYTELENRFPGFFHQELRQAKIDEHLQRVRIGNMLREQWEASDLEAAAAKQENERRQKADEIPYTEFISGKYTPPDAEIRQPTESNSTSDQIIEESGETPPRLNVDAITKSVKTEIASREDQEQAQAPAEALPKAPAEISRPASLDTERGQNLLSAWDAAKKEEAEQKRLVAEAKKVATDAEQQPRRETAATAEQGAPGQPNIESEPRHRGVFGRRRVEAPPATEARAEARPAQRPESKQAEARTEAVDLRAVVEDLHPANKKRFGELGVNARALAGSIFESMKTSDVVGRMRTGWVERALRTGTNVEVGLQHKITESTQIIADQETFKTQLQDTKDRAAALTNPKDRAQVVEQARKEMVAADQKIEGARKNIRDYEKTLSNRQAKSRALLEKRKTIATEIIEKYDRRYKPELLQQNFEVAKSKEQELISQIKAAEALVTQTNQLLSGLQVLNPSKAESKRVDAHRKQLNAELARQQKALDANRKVHGKARTDLNSIEATLGRHEAAVAPWQDVLGRTTSVVSPESSDAKPEPVVAAPSGTPVYENVRQPAENLDAGDYTEGWEGPPRELENVEEVSQAAESPEAHFEKIKEQFKLASLRPDAIIAWWNTSSETGKANKLDDRAFDEPRYPAHGYTLIKRLQRIYKKSDESALFRDFDAMVKKWSEEPDVFMYSK